MTSELEDGADFFRSIEHQPEEIRQLLIYVICETMTQAKMLDLVGVSNSPISGTTILYRNPDTGEVFEIPKPQLSEVDECAMKDDIRRMLTEATV